MPTVVRARPADRVCQEEVFGPFVTVTTFKDENEVIEIANDTAYGLGGGLWTRDLSRAHRVAALDDTAAWSGSIATNASIRDRRLAASRGRATAATWDSKRCTDYTTAKSVWVNVDANLPAFYRR